MKIALSGKKKFYTFAYQCYLMEDEMDNKRMESLKGMFFMAMPELNDPNFHQTVTCICQHTSEGAVGLVVNRVHPYLVGKDIFKALNIKCCQEIESLPIHVGGPVHNSEIFVLHGYPFDWEGCYMITDGFAMSNSMSMLRAIANGEGPESFIVLLGCAGWSAGQIETEIKNNVWLFSSMCKDILFDIPVERRWRELLKKIGVDPVLLTSTAGHS